MLAARRAMRSAGSILSYAATVLAESALVSYWRLNEASGTIATDSKGTNNGTYTGGFTLNQAGAVTGGRSVLLNGTTGFVNVPDTASLEFTGAFSVEAWVNPTTQAAAYGIVGKWLSSVGYVLLVDPAVGGKLELWLNGVHVDSTTAPAVTAGSWNYVAATYDGANATVYVNGSVVGGPTALAAPSSGTAALNMGAYGGGLNNLNGSIAEIAVYNAALSSTRVAAHYAAR